MAARGGGRGRRSERPHRLKVARPLAGRGRGRSSRPLIGAEADPQQDPNREGEGNRGSAAPENDRRRDCRVPSDGALDRLCGAEANRGSASSRASSRRSRPTATSESARASSSTSTSRSWDGSSFPATASRAIARSGPAAQATGPSARPAGSSATSASTTLLAWPTSRSWQTSAARPPPASCAGRSPGSPRWASPSSG
jgi:hypothetical protein